MRDRHRAGRSKITRRSAPLMLAPLLMSGCATVTEGTRQDVTIVTTGTSGALCVIANADGEEMARVTSPGRASVPRERTVLRVRCAQEGYRPGQADVRPSVSPRSRVQAPLGYAVDGLSGAMWRYPSEVSVEMVRIR